MEKIVSGYNIEIIATSEIYTVSVIVHFVPEGQTFSYWQLQFVKLWREETYLHPLV
jgi:hypothetical protein